MNSLAPYVNRFVLSECPVTHSGKTKPLFFQENKERFKDFNITHVIVKDYEQYLGQNAWVMEHYQREFLMNGINGAGIDEMILLSDVDEIPNLKDYPADAEGVFRQKKYYYYLNGFSGRVDWRGTIAMRRKNINTLNGLRNRRGRLPGIMRNGGWHFSTMGTVKEIVYKIESFAHQELNTPERKSVIEENRKKLLDPYNRAWPGKEFPMTLKIEMPDGPEWLLKNIDRYPHLLAENGRI